jgi:WD40 repeat protein
MASGKAFFLGVGGDESKTGSI